MTGPLPPDQEFQTWSEIAEYLRISVREALYRAKNEGLPVRRGPGKKSRVWALRSELDAWKLKGPASEVLPAPDSVIEQPPADSPSSPSPVDERRAPAVRWGRRTLLAVAGLAAGVVGGGLILGTRRQRVERAVLTGNLLTALDGLGRTIWTHRFPGVLKEQGADELSWRVQVVDLENHGSPGVLAVCSRFGQSSITQIVSDELSYFTPDGHVKWTLPCRPDLLDFDGKEFEPVWWCSHVIAVPSRTQPALWVGINHGWRWPGCVMRLDAAGAASVQFANAGHVERLSIVTRPSGQFVVIAGENNAFERTAAAVLGVTDSPACSPSGGAARCRFANSPSGVLRDYMLFPTTEMVAASDTPYGLAKWVTQTNDGGFVVIVQVPSSPSACLLYEFTGATEPRSVMPSGSCPMVHRRLQEEGKLDHSWAVCPELDRPLTIRHWRPGNGWQDQEFTWRATTDKG